MKLLSRIAALSACCAALLLAGCATGLPKTDSGGIAPDAASLLQQSMQAHGAAAYDRINDISVSYQGEWNHVAAWTQPVLIDRQFRGASEERLLLGRQPVVSQRHTGPGGLKQVERTSDSIEVFYNNSRETEPEPLAAAALVADAYRMFLTGPFYFRDGVVSLALAGEDSVDGFPCKLISVVRRPGHGLSGEDRYLLFIDQKSALLRRIRFSMEGLESTQGAVVEVDLLDHIERGGVQWPTHFIERIRKPIPLLPVHEWHMTGLDLNRGFSRSDIESGVFSDKAEAAAQEINGMK